MHPMCMVYVFIAHCCIWNRNDITINIFQSAMDSGFWVLFWWLILCCDKIYNKSKICRNSARKTESKIEFNQSKWLLNGVTKIDCMLKGGVVLIGSDFFFFRSECSQSGNIMEDFYFSVKPAKFVQFRKFKRTK